MQPVQYLNYVVFAKVFKQRDNYKVHFQNRTAHSSEDYIYTSP